MRFSTTFNTWSVVLVAAAMVMGTTATTGLLPVKLVGFFTDGDREVIGLGPLVNLTYTEEVALTDLHATELNCLTPEGTALMSFYGSDGGLRYHSWLGDFQERNKDCEAIVSGLNKALPVNTPPVSTRWTGQTSTSNCFLMGSAETATALTGLYNKGSNCPAPAPTPTPAPTPNTAAPTPAPQCKSWCQSHGEQDWAIKCAWRQCVACTECPTAAPTVAPSPAPTPTPTAAPTPEPTPEPQCKSWCEGHAVTDWAIKCAWRQCVACAKCPTAAPARCVDPDTFAKLTDDLKKLTGASEIIDKYFPNGRD